MKRILFLSAATALVWAGASLQPAQAGVDISFNFGPAPCYPVYYVPCPPPVVYYQPVVVYPGCAYRPCPPGYGYGAYPYRGGYHGEVYGRSTGRYQQDGRGSFRQGGMARTR
jgi:hypothetical protein